MKRFRFEEEPVTPELPMLLTDEVVRRGLFEDLGRAGDLTSDAIIDVNSVTTAQIVARKPGRLAGLVSAARAFEMLDPNVKVVPRAADGAAVAVGDVVLEIEGRARAILGAERTALNLLGHLSGVATLTAEYVSAIEATRARVVCTRKTTPGLRALEKYAVRCGGGSNHRFGLDDGVLVKDNHLVVAGGVREAVRRVRSVVGHMVVIEVEVDTLAQLDEALDVGVQAVLLDNMEPATLAKAVERVDGTVVTEASGGISLKTAAAVAATGVDLLSVGALTHSAPVLDLALDI